MLTLRRQLRVLDNLKSFLKTKEIQYQTYRANRFIKKNIEDSRAFANNVYGDLPWQWRDIVSSYYALDYIRDSNYQKLRNEAINDLRAIEITIRTNGELTWWLTSPNPAYRKYIEVRLAALGKKI